MASAASRVRERRMELIGPNANAPGRPKLVDRTNVFRLVRESCEPH